MREAFSTWPSKIMESKWKVGELCLRPILIVSEATGHNFMEVECSGNCEKNLAIAREIAQHVVDLHNSQLRK